MLVMSSRDINPEVMSKTGINPEVSQDITKP